MVTDRRAARASALVTLLLLAGCTEPAPPEPRDAALDACEEMARHQYDLSSAGDSTEVRELTTEADHAFEVTGAHGDTEWICTWESTDDGGGTLTETTIDNR